MYNKNNSEIPIHAAIIMDGNGRWAQARGLVRTEGHKQGVEAAATTVREAVRLGIKTLTLYAFSSDNWKRPKAEVETLMGLMKQFLRDETSRCLKEGIRLDVIGRRDRLSAGVRFAIERAESLTRDQSRLILRIAIDYSARDALALAASQFQGEPPCRDAFSAAYARAIHAAIRVSDIDILIRTGGEQRLSDFLLWESAYAELFFLEKFWPDFCPDDLSDALEQFHVRNRRFGRVEPALAT